MIQRIFLSALVFTLAACGDSEVRVSDGLGPSADTSKSGTYVSIQGLSASAVDRLVIRVSPDNTTSSLAYDKNRGTFAGYLVLSAGDHVLNASAYSGADGGAVVGTGTAAVTVPAGGSAAVSMTIYDTTTVTPVNGDIAPIISRFTASKVSINVNESITLSVDAIDLDGDALSYAWSDDCGGTFASPTTATTTWKNGTSGACLLSITVSARSLSQTSTLSVAVSRGGDGTATVSGSFIGRPTIYSISVNGQHPGNDYFGVTFYRDGYVSGGGNAGFNVWNLQASSWVSLYISSDNTANLTASVSDNCGGSMYDAGTPSPTNVSWIAPAVSDGGVTVCKVTTSVSNGTFQDSFAFGVEVR